MITTARSATKAGTPRRLRRQAIGLLAAKSERFDFKTRCRKCGSTPTQLVCRGPIIIERTCHNCGDVEFLDAPAVARQRAGSPHAYPVSPPVIASAARQSRDGNRVSFSNGIATSLRSSR